MHYTVWGDDGNEQYLFDRNFPGTSEGIEGVLRASNRGLEYRRELVLPRGTLNEDKDDTDEVFVKVDHKNVNADWDDSSNSVVPAEVREATNETKSAKTSVTV
jgi:hypothetical protein